MDFRSPSRMIFNNIKISSSKQVNAFDIFLTQNAILLDVRTLQEFARTKIAGAKHLSLCQKIIFRHQGDIWIESELGKGTTFFFAIKKNLEQFYNTNKNLGSENQVEGDDKGNKINASSAEPMNV